MEAEDFPTSQNTTSTAQHDTKQPTALKEAEDFATTLHRTLPASPCRHVHSAQQPTASKEAEDFPPAPANTGPSCTQHTTASKEAEDFTPSQQRLIALYAEMADLTRPECARCRVPHSCCEDIYCEMAIRWAAEHWGVQLERQPGGRGTRGGLPLMGPNGCTAAPHLRPICTVHTCDVNSLGCKKGDPAWTRRYFELREQLEELDYDW